MNYIKKHIFIYFGVVFLISSCKTVKNHPYSFCGEWKINYKKTVEFYKNKKDFAKTKKFIKKFRKNEKLVITSKLYINEIPAFYETGGKNFPKVITSMFKRIFDYRVLSKIGNSYKLELKYRVDGVLKTIIMELVLIDDHLEVYSKPKNNNTILYQYYDRIKHNYQR